MAGGLSGPRTNQWQLSAPGPAFVVLPGLLQPLCFYYASTAAMRVCQRLLLDIWALVINYCKPPVPLEVRCLNFEIISLIMWRAELSHLRKLGFRTGASKQHGLRMRGPSPNLARPPSRSSAQTPGHLHGLNTTCALHCVRSSAITLRRPAPHLWDVAIGWL